VCANDWFPFDSSPGQQMVLVESESHVQPLMCCDVGARQVLVSL
jgi:hypothetical protein